MSDHEERLKLIKEHLSNAKCTTFKLKPKAMSKPRRIGGYMVGDHMELNGLEVKITDSAYEITDPAVKILNLNRRQRRQRFRYDANNTVVPYNPK